MGSDVRGALNLAAAESFSFRDAVRARHRASLPLPVPLARAALGAAWKLSGWGGEPAWIDGLARNLTLDCSRALRELGWRSRRTAAQLLQS